MSNITPIKPPSAEENVKALTNLAIYGLGELSPADLDYLHLLPTAKFNDLVAQLNNYAESKTEQLFIVGKVVRGLRLRIAGSADISYLTAEQSKEYSKFLKNNLPGFGNSYLTKAAQVVALLSVEQVKQLGVSKAIRICTDSFPFALRERVLTNPDGYTNRDLDDTMRELKALSENLDTAPLSALNQEKAKSAALQSRVDYLEQEVAELKAQVAALLARLDAA